MLTAYERHVVSQGINNHILRLTRLDRKRPYYATIWLQWANALLANDETFDDLNAIGLLRHVSFVRGNHDKVWERIFRKSPSRIVSSETEAIVRILGMVTV